MAPNPNPSPNPNPLLLTPVTCPNQADGTGLNLNLGTNVKASSTSFNTSNLPVVTNAFLQSNFGLNVNPTTINGVTQSYLTIDQQGDINTAGYINTQGDVNVGAKDSNGNYAINLHADTGTVNTIGNVNVASGQVLLKNTGEVDISGNLLIGSNGSYNKFQVDSSTGTTNIGPNKLVITGTSGNLDMSGNLNINVGKVQLTNQGVANLYGNLNVGTDASYSQFIVDSTTGTTNIGKSKIVLTAPSGNVDMSGNLNINQGKVQLTNQGIAKISGNVNVGSDANYSQFIIDSTTGTTNIGQSKIVLTAPSGNVDMSGNLNINQGKAQLTNQGVANLYGNLNLGTDASYSKVVINSVTGNTNIAKGGFVVDPVNSAANTIYSLNIGTDASYSQFIVSSTDGTTNIGHKNILLKGSTGEVDISGNLLVGNDGSYNRFQVNSSTGTTNIGPNKLVITGPSGHLDMSGNLNVNVGKIVLKNDGSANLYGNLNIGTDANYSQFTVSSTDGTTNIGHSNIILKGSSGEVDISGNLLIGNDGAYTKFQVNSSTGTTNIGPNKLVITGPSGNLDMSGNLNVNNKQIVLNNDGSANLHGYLNLGSDATYSQFIVSPTDGTTNIGHSNIILKGSSGEVDISGNLLIGNDGAYNRFQVTSSTGTTNIGPNKLVITGPSGNLDMSGNVNINVGKVVLNNDGSANFRGWVNVGSDATYSQFTINPLDGTTNIGHSNIILKGSSGEVDISGNLLIGNDGSYNRFQVTSSTGTTNIGPNKLVITGPSGNLDMSGNLNINVGKIVLKNDGSANLYGNLNIGTDASYSQFTVNSATGLTNIGRNALVVNPPAGKVDTSCNLNIGTDPSYSKFIVNAQTGKTTIAGGSVVLNDASGNVDISGNLYVGSSLYNKFTVNASSGQTNIAGKLQVGPSFGTANVTIDTSGVISTTLPYSAYVPPASSDNTTTTSVAGTGAPSFTSSTSQYLATQTYVDQQLWKQTVRINTILGSSGEVINSFNNVYQLVQALEGSTTATAIGGMLDRVTEVKETLKDVVGFLSYTYNVACAASVWGNESIPLPIPSRVFNVAGFQGDGWYFKNMVQESNLMSNNITWSVPINGNTMMFKDIQQIFMNVFVINNASLPSIVVTTTGGNTTKYTFTAPTANTNYCLYTSTPMLNVTTDSSGVFQPQNVYNVTRQGAAVSTVGTVNPTDKILSIVIQTDATMPENTIEFVLSSVNIKLATGTTTFNYLNSSVTTMYLFNYFFNKFPDFSNFAETQLFYLSSYNQENQGQSNAQQILPPKAPTDLSANYTNQGVTLKWTAPTDIGNAPNLLGYIVSQSTDNTNFTMVPQANISFSNSPLGANVSGLTNGTTYYFQVLAVNEAGESPAVKFAAIIPSTVPSKPKNLAATAGESRVTLTWSQPDSNGGNAITGYNVYFTTAGNDNYALFGSTTSSVFTKVVTGLTDGQQYAFLVKAQNINGESVAVDADKVLSTPVNVFAPLPSVLTVTQVGPYQTQNSGFCSVQVTYSSDCSAANHDTNLYYQVVASSVRGLRFSSKLLNTYQNTISGIDSGYAQTFYVIVSDNYNSSATGPSTSSSYTFKEVPGIPLLSITPTNVTANGGIRMSWSNPGNGGGNLGLFEIKAYSDASGTQLVYDASFSGNSATIPMTNFTKGNPYYAKVAASNEVGQSQFSALVGPFIPSDPPAAPAVSTQSYQNQQITLSWSPPDNNGATITGYKVFNSSYQQVTVTTSTSFTISGLTNGTSYTHYVKSTNVSGDSAYSAPAVATPATTPQPPTSVSASSFQNQQTTISWTAPTQTGGDAITSYNLYQNGTQVQTGITGTSVTRGSLTNGNTYTFAVQAVNHAGASAQSSTVTVTPAAAPDAPTLVTALSYQNAQSEVSWTAGSSNGDAITTYTVTGFNADESVFSTTSTASTSATITGLTNGSSYYFQVTATNRAGSSSASASSNTATPARTPSTPTLVSATSHQNQASTITWSFSDASNNNGFALSSYSFVVTAYDASSNQSIGTQSVTGATTVTFNTNLVNGNSYYFKVHAVLASLQSPQSAASNIIKPATEPDSPINLVVTADASNAGQVLVQWSAPANNGGAPIQSYTVLDDQGTQYNSPITNGATSVVLTGLISGQQYNLSVYATNSEGNSLPTTPYQSVTPL